MSEEASHIDDSAGSKLRQRRVWLIGIAVLAALVGGRYLQDTGSISGAELGRSLERATDNSVLGHQPCVHLEGSRFKCPIYDRDESGQATYHVVLTGDCWTGTKITPDSFEEGTLGYLPKRASACVTSGDQGTRGWLIAAAFVLVALTCTGAIVTRRP